MMPTRLIQRTWRLGNVSFLLFLVPATIFLLIFALYPAIQLIGMSVADVTTANLFKEWPLVGLANFEAVLASEQFWPALGNTFVFVAVILLIGEAGGLCAALLLRGSRRSVEFVLGLLVFAWALPSVVNGVVWRFLFSEVGAINGLLVAFGIAPADWLTDRTLVLLSVAFATAWASLPFSALIFRAAILDISSDLIEAAEVDGATGWRVIRHIYLPLLRPTALILAVLVIVYAFRSFDYIYVMTRGGPGSSTTTIPYLSYKLAFQQFDFGAGAAAAAIAVLMMLGLAAFYVRAVLKEEQH